MKPHNRTLLWMVVLGLAVVALFVQISLNVDLEGRSTVEFALVETKKAEGSSPAEAVMPSKKVKVSELPCFDCHNPERYRRGNTFAHEDHEDVGHCHRCHAFEGHMQVSIRREACEECH